MAKRTNRIDMHPEYRNEWIEAGYVRNMGSAEVVRPPQSDYIRLYHLTSATHAKDDIENQHIKIAQIDGLNDPFELLPVDTRRKKTKEAVEKFKNKYKENHGLLSFSANWINPVLWGHYADKHKGVCLGFDVRRSRVNPMVYVEDRIRLPDGQNPTDKILEKLLCTKFHHWSYESEYRMVVQLTPKQKKSVQGVPCGRCGHTSPSHHHFLSFKDNADLKLREVIFGGKCSQETKNDINEALKGMQTITSFSVRLAHKWFHLVPDEKSLKGDV